MSNSLSRSLALALAATALLAEGGAYYGPSKLNELRGLPKLANEKPQAKMKRLQLDCGVF